MTRLCKIKGFHNFIGGKDNDKVFDEGVVYEAKKICGEIILTPIFKQCKYDNDGAKIENLRLDEVISTGQYLILNDE